jgi:hypothetical protein
VSQSNAQGVSSGAETTHFFPKPALVRNGHVIGQRAPQRRRHCVERKKKLNRRKEEDYIKERQGAE